MTEIIDFIDNEIYTCLGRGKSYGLCRQVQDDSGIYPATVKTPSKKVTPDDKWKLAWFHRLLENSPDEDEDQTFGRKIAIRNQQQIRTIVVIELGEGETLIDDFINALPDYINETLITETDYRYIQVMKSISVSRGDTVWEAEWGQAYKDKHQMRYNIYALEYNIDYIKCQACVN